ncbi:MAG: cytochrome-c peroxidase [Hyphomicrobiaceae bacterium]
MMAPPTSGSASIATALLTMLIASNVTSAAEGLLLNPEVIERLVRHGPWPPKLVNDASNRISGRPKGIAFGEKLFFDRRLSIDKSVSCADCHQPARGWTDGRRIAKGLAVGIRNTMPVVNTRFNRWFGWDGSNDNLWAQSMRAILAPNEMGANGHHVAEVLAADLVLRKEYADLFGEPISPKRAETILVNIGKALASFQETLVSARTKFDTFRDALERGDWEVAARYPRRARRGAAIFVGRGKCNVCHSGPMFTSGEFHDAGMPYFVRPGQVDAGRFSGITRLKASRWNLASRWNDDPTKRGAWASRQVMKLHRNFGEFKIPSLRNLTRTDPYMHNGSIATLHDVVRHYSEIDTERLHGDGERLLRPLRLSPPEINDLVAFLRTLSEHDE